MADLKKIQIGRSMVEIVGVLSIVGLLSIIGLYAYKWAINKHKANEITATVHRKLPIVAAALINDNITEDYYEDVAGAEVYLSEKDNTDYLPDRTDKKFRINVENTSSELCERLLSSFRDAKTKPYSVTGDLNCDKESNNLGFIYNTDLSSDCEPGEGRQLGFCKPCEDGLMSDGHSDCGTCDPGKKASSDHTSCVPCTEEEVCGCEKKSDGKGGCTDCVKNNDCGSGNMCYSGFCYICPKYALCNPDVSGFECLEGYVVSGKTCCPKNAECSINNNGGLIVSCRQGTYYKKEGGLESCPPCPSHATCTGEQKGFSCEEGYEMQGDGCCPVGATCTSDEEGEYEVASCPEGTYLSDGECLT